MEGRIHRRAYFRDGAGCHTHRTGQPLENQKLTVVLGGKERSGEHTPHSAAEVNRDGVYDVIDLLAEKQRKGHEIKRARHEWRFSTTPITCKTAVIFQKRETNLWARGPEAITMTSSRDRCTFAGRVSGCVARGHCLPRS